MLVYRQWPKPKDNWDAIVAETKIRFYPIRYPPVPNTGKGNYELFAFNFEISL